MSSSNLFRWSGLGFLLAGILLPLSWYIRFAEGDSGNPATVMSALYVTEHTLAIIGVILTLFGLVGIYTRQIRETGRVGLLGFLALFTGTVLLGGLLFFEGYVVPAIAATKPSLHEDALFNVPTLLVPAIVLSIFNLLGFVLLGVATMRANVLPRWAALLFIIGGILYSPGPNQLPWIVFTIGTTVVGLAQIWLGYALWSEKSERATILVKEAQRVV
jgi:hypothetical protein